MRRGTKGRTLSVLITFFLAMIGSGASAGRGDAVPGAFQPTFEAVACPEDVRALTAEGSVLTCGFLTVLEDHSDPTGSTIRLFVVQAAPETGDTLPDPFFVPGRDLVGRSPSSIPFGYNPTGRVVITMDRRGAGRSTPSLACPEVRQLTAAGTNLVLGSSQTRGALLGAVEACHDRLVAQGIDLNMYNVAEMAADAEDLRLALGIDEWNLLTYGTASAISFEILRRYPEHIRSASFDSPLPPTVDRFTGAIEGTEYAFDQIATACSVRPACHRAYPRMHAAWNDALGRLDREPSTFSDEDVRIVVDDAAAVRYLRNNMAQGINESSDVREFPLAISELRERGWENGGPAGNEVGWASTPPFYTGYEVQWGDPGVIQTEALADAWLGRPSEGTFYSYMCHDELPFVDHDALVTAAGDRPWYVDAYVDAPYPEICDRWSVTAADVDPHEPVTSSVPVLLMSGRFDPYSPFPLVRQGTQELANRTIFRAPARSRNVLSIHASGSDCTIAIRNAFVIDPSVPPDTSCLVKLGRLEPTTFVHPALSTRDPRPGEPIVTTFAGDGAHGSSGDGNLATDAQIDSPSDVEVDADGNVYVLELNGERVRKIDATTGRISTVVGSPTGIAPRAIGQASAVDLGEPTALAISPEGDIYVGGGDGTHRMITKVEGVSGATTIVAGTGEQGYSGDGGPATEATMTHVRDIAVDDVGNVYFSDFQNQRVRKVDTDGIITTIAGTGQKGYSGDGGPAVEAELNRPSGVFADGGNIYIADQGNLRIRKIDGRGIIHTIAGNGRSGYSGDAGPARRARIGRPSGVAVDGEGNAYIASQACACVRKVDPQGVITTVAGRGIAGFSGDGGPAKLATFSGAIRVALGPDGALYIADASNFRIRRVVFPS